MIKFNYTKQQLFKENYRRLWTLSYKNHSFTVVKFKNDKPYTLLVFNGEYFNFSDLFKRKEKIDPFKNAWFYKVKNFFTKDTETFEFTKECINCGESLEEKRFDDRFIVAKFQGKCIGCYNWSLYKKEINRKFIKVGDHIFYY